MPHGSHVCFLHQAQVQEDIPEVRLAAGILDLFSSSLLPNLLISLLFLLTFLFDDTPRTHNEPPSFYYLSCQTQCTCEETAVWIKAVIVIIISSLLSCLSILFHSWWSLILTRRTHHVTLVYLLVCLSRSLVFSVLFWFEVLAGQRQQITGTMINTNYGDADITSQTSKAWCITQFLCL